MVRISILLTLILLSQCNEKEPDILMDEDGVIISTPFLWSKLLSESGGYLGGFLHTSVTYNNGILMGAQDKSNSAYLAFLDIETGDIIWKADFYRKTDFFSIDIPYQYENNMISLWDSKNVNLDMETGIISWITDINDDVNVWFTGIDSIFIIISREEYPLNNYPVYGASKGNINEGNYQLFLMPDLGNLPTPDIGRSPISIGGFRFLKPFKDSLSQNTMLLCYYDKNYYLPNSEDMVSQCYMGLYNYTLSLWVYERIEMGAYNCLEGFTPTIVGNRIYHTLSGGVTECRDLNTGSLIWKNEGNYQFSYRGFIIVGTNMIVCDDWQNIIAYNTGNGHVVWESPSPGGAGYMSELNGVVYFAGVGRIHALDATTGKILWRLDSPNMKTDYHNIFKDECTVIPGKNGEKGKVIVSSLTHAYCYESIR